MIELGSDALRVVIDPERGGEIVFVGRPGGPNVLFHEPWATPVPAGGSVSYGDGTLDWLSHYRGGWQVMFPNAGDACIVDGVPHPVHGEVSSAPATVVDRGPTHVALRSPTRLPIVLERRISLAAAGPVLLVEERIENLADLGFSYAWGHHPAFAASTGMRIDLPVGPVLYDAVTDASGTTYSHGTWPAITRPSGEAEHLDRLSAPPIETGYVLPDRPAGWAALRDLASRSGIAMAWDVVAFPHVWLWEEVGGPSFPWFGRARIVAVEPVSIWPGDGLARAVERGQARHLAPRAQASAWLTISLFEATDEPVTGVARDGEITWERGLEAG